MLTLRLSVIRSTEPAMEYLRSVLREYEADQRLKVDLLTQEWPTAWSDLIRITTHGIGPDVSVVGTTWIAALAAMQALRPFEPGEIEPLGAPLHSSVRSGRPGARTAGFGRSPGWPIRA